MGCDIHAAMEFRNGTGKWEAVAVPDPYYGKYDWHSEPMTYDLDINRDYDLFSILGNVRNGYGFAGVDTGDGYEPMTDNRGVPEDISDAAKGVLSDEHSATWVSLRDILEYNWDRTTKHRGWVSQSVFEKWERMKEWSTCPESWCGGGNFPKITNDEMRQAIEDGEALPRAMTLVEWEESYASSARQLWEKVMPKMLALGHKYGHDNVRLVMDFDS